jgi:hypothetical protein
MFVLLGHAVNRKTQRRVKARIETFRRERMASPSYVEIRERLENSDG